MYYVYVHTVPNGKMYVGKAQDLNNRWGRDGENYITNEAFHKDIKKYGWDKIKHEVIAEYATDKGASLMEVALITLLNTEDKKHGYNQTDFRERALTQYANRNEVRSPESAQYKQAVSFFESYDLSTYEGQELIDKWIFNKRQREILKDRLLDDIPYSELVSKYNRSERALKNIVREGCQKIEKHL